MITVMLVDDHCLIRAGLRHILETAPDIKIISECRNGEDALQLARKHKPQLVIIGAAIPGMGGLESTRRFTERHPEIRVITLIAQSHGPYPGHLLSAGAAGCLSKEYIAADLLRAIRHVVAGKRFISPDIAGGLADVWAGTASASPFTTLSIREMEVMQMVLQGRGTKRIAACLNLSPQTISTYRQRLFGKLDVRNDVELIRLALRFGLLEDQHGA